MNIVPYESNQQVFEKIVTHLFNQGEQSKTHDNDAEQDYCVYRGPNNTSCAIGCVIPDELYRPEMDDESMTAIQLFNNENTQGVRELFKNIDLPFLSAMQHLHDDDKAWVSTAKMQLGVIAVAATFDLDASFVQNLSFKDR